MKSKFKKILIYGLGLIGASISLKLKSVDSDCKTTGIVRSKKSKDKGISLNISNEIFTEDEFLKFNNWNDFDLIIFALPVNLTCEKILELPDNFQGIITDVGSTKKEIIQTVEKKFQTKHNYISSHPMAGSEQTGLEFSKENLFENKLCILTKPKNANLDIYFDIEDFWKSLGSITIEMNSEEHDEVLAYLSHTPHLLSSLLVNWAYENDKVQNKTNAFDFPLTGGGFRDMSRIAGSNPEMWDAIINSNKTNIIDSLEKYKVQIENMISSLKKNQDESYWKNYFIQSKTNRAKILKLKE